MKSEDKLIIGRAELLHFVDFDIADIPSKVDSGAYGCAVHASDVVLSEDGKTLSFTILGGHPVFGKLAKQYTTTDFKKIRIINSFGHHEIRFKVMFTVQLAGQTMHVPFSLADRQKMIFPILLGRVLTNGRFLIDTTQTNVDRLGLKSKYSIALPGDKEQDNEDSDSI